MDKVYIVLFSYSFESGECIDRVYESKEAAKAYVESVRTTNYKSYWIQEYTVL